MKRKIVILGGGIAGLSAAHELIERQFDVEVYEAQRIAGGKARSFPVPGSGTEGRLDLPAEHGFRFFPRFYRHITDTMRRIPYRNGVVADNLVDTSRCQLARFGRHPVEFLTRSPRTMMDVRVVFDDIGRLIGGDLGLSHEELAFFGARLWQIATSCRERRLAEYEKIGWWKFIGASERSPAYQKLLGYGFTRSLVAAKAEMASTKTVGDMCIQLMFDAMAPGKSTDQVLNGPTNDVWINPWLEYLQSKGVKYCPGARARGVTFDDGIIREAHIERDGKLVAVPADIFIFALPVEDVIDLVTPEMIAADPALGHLFTLDDITEWMNGIQIYLNEDVRISHGHVIYVDSPWALTSISQAQFWSDTTLSAYGDGTVRGVISVDISEWNEKGLNGKAARDCTVEEINADVWEQLKRSLNYGDNVILRDEQVVAFSLDPGIQRSKEGTTSNEEPLLVNLIDTWKLRPDAVTRIPNLFLAADYIRTYTDLATMEAANEAARHAVNGILKLARSDAAPCDVWALYEPELFAPWRELDRIRFARGLPWDDTLAKVGLVIEQFLDSILNRLERGSEEHNIFSHQDLASDVAQKEIVSLIARDAPNVVTSELRRDGMAFVERLTQLFAIRLAEAERNERANERTNVAATARGLSRPGMVDILPN